MSRLTARTSQRRLLRKLAPASLIVAAFVAGATPANAGNNLSSGASGGKAGGKLVSPGGLSHAPAGAGSGRRIR